ncbi:MAG TPA: hypothetical protein VHV75_11070 [Solirubrobacteraceae bacterium]|jgi:hypothetical protein|nr:hypothetical protein [Solirubrobacteraceae bacterium]
MSDPAGSAILDDVAEEGRRLAVAAVDAELPLRLLGGVAVWVQCQSARTPPLARAYGDADFLARGNDRKRITAFMEKQGYEADRMFNALHGATRLNFHDPVRDRPLDILLDKFVMAHELDLRNSSAADGLTIALADLLMTKLQVVSINEKDVRDLAALMVDHGFSHDEIELERVLAVTHNDWGLEHTIHGTLATLVELVGNLGVSPYQAELVSTRARELEEALNAAPKGTKWKMRARIGERVKWYEEPEEARG